MFDKWLIWVLRLVVAVLPFVVTDASRLFGDSSLGVRNTAAVVSWLLWAASIFAVFVLHPIALTALRIASPTIATLLIALALTDATDARSIAGSALGVAMLLLAFNAEVGNSFVQANAYGDEKRFLLRPPVALIAPTVLAGAVLISASIAAPMLFAAERFVAAGFATVISAISIWFFPRRIHQLSRRWFVLVPAGFVVHDETLLGTNLMIRKQDVISVDFAKRDTQSADLTAMTWGVPLDLEFKQPLDVSLSALSARHLKASSAIHAKSILVAPSRPGAVLRAITDADKSRVVRDSKLAS